MMTLLLSEASVVALITAAPVPEALDGVNVYAATQDGERELPCIVVECVQLKPLGSSAIASAELSVTLHAHAEDVTAAQHAAWFDALTTLLYNQPWKGLEIAGVHFYGAHLGVRDARKEGFHWVAELRIRAGQGAL
jgi:hypothetical protein